MAFGYDPLTGQDFSIKGKIILTDETKAVLQSMQGNVAQATGKSGESFKSFGAIATTAIGNFAAGIALRAIPAMINMVKEGTVLSAQAVTLENGFNAMTRGIDSNILSLVSLREATQGTVSDVGLLKAANNALALGLPTEQLNELFRAAQIVGNAMGRTTLEAVNDLTTGIGRQSRLILDNLGIIVNAEAAYKAYAGSIGKTSSELSDAEKKTAFMTIAIEKLNEKARVLEGTTGDTQIALERWNATVENTKVALGAAVGEVILFVDEINKLTIEFIEAEKAGTQVIESFEGLTSSAEDTTQTFVDYVDGIDIGNEAMLAAVYGAEQYTETVDLTAMALDDYTDLVSRTTYEQRELTVTQEEGADVAELLAEVTLGLEGDLRLLQWQVESTEAALSDLDDQMDSINLTQAELRLEQMLLRDAYEDGRITETQYEEAAEKLEGQMRDLRIQQQELRIETMKYDNVLEDQQEAVESFEDALESLGGESEDVLQRMKEDLGHLDEAQGSIIRSMIDNWEDYRDELSQVFDTHGDIDDFLDNNPPGGDTGGGDTGGTVPISDNEWMKSGGWREGGVSKTGSTSWYDTKALAQAAWDELISGKDSGTSSSSKYTSRAAAQGFQGLVDRPTMFLAGEAGPEYLSIVPKGRQGYNLAGGEGGGGSVTIHVNNPLPFPDDPGQLKRLAEYLREIEQDEIRSYGYRG